ncbi:hypothetical protein ARMGADRAFT_139548 [Armillaria gallica]|uniref:Uncharacterized protein n=1 Tax=Armillaria gallica TaxID=47427 RepID=A0A2H3DCA0_ARMGA|nr:hypothetical protein ARMGADRAFT_139548 [Armillaria gallica]
MSCINHKIQLHPLFTQISVGFRPAELSACYMVERLASRCLVSLGSAPSLPARRSQYARRTSRNVSRKSSTAFSSNFLTNLVSSSSSKRTLREPSYARIRHTSASPLARAVAHQNQKPSDHGKDYRAVNRFSKGRRITGFRRDSS